MPAPACTVGAALHYRQLSFMRYRINIYIYVIFELIPEVLKENIWPAVYVTSIETRLKKGQAAINKRKSDSQKRATISPPPSAKKKKNMPNPKKNPTTLSVKMAQTIPTATATPASQKKTFNEITPQTTESTSESPRKRSTDQGTTKSLL